MPILGVMRENMKQQCPAVFSCPALRFYRAAAFGCLYGARDREPAYRRHLRDLKTGHSLEILSIESDNTAVWLKNKSASLCGPRLS